MIPDLSQAMIKALQLRYDNTWVGDMPPSWITCVELRVGTGYKGDNEQRIDFWAMQSVGGNMKIAIEMKVSRSDFLNEMKKPLKRRPGLRLSNKFYFYAPIGMLKPTEIPPECGLLEFDPEYAKYNSYNIIETIKAPYRDVFPPTWSFIASIHRNLTRQFHKEASDVNA